MAMTVREIRTWLEQFSDDTLIGISEEDEMALRPHDERYHEAYLEIGMALSSEYLAEQRLPYVIPTPEIMEAQREAAIEDFLRTYPAAMIEASDKLRVSMESAGIDCSKEYKPSEAVINLFRFPKTAPDEHQ